MNFIFEDFGKYDCNMEEYLKTLKRAKALIENPQVIFNLFGDTEETYGMEYSIHSYADDYSDEVWVERFSHKSNMKEFSHIEILTSEQAKRNEIEEIKGKCIVGVTEEDIPNYKLGETVQTYTQIGNTDYWYREL